MMLTIGVMVRQENWLSLALGEGGDQEVAGVWPAAGGPPVGPEGWTNLLAVVTGPPNVPGLASVPDGDRYAALVADLARRGAAGMVTGVPASALLLAAARRYRLPVVEADCPGLLLIPRLAQVVTMEAGTAMRAAAVESERVRRLLDLACGREDAAGVLRWLAAASGGQAVVVAPHQRLPAVRGLVLPQEQIREVSEGTTTVPFDVETAAGDVLRLYGVGQMPPRKVLVVVLRDRAWTPQTGEAARRAERVLALWEAQRLAGEEDRAQAGTAVLHLLLDGQAAAARRVADLLGLSSEVLRAGRVQVCAVSVRASRRGELVESLRRRLGDDALVAAGSPEDCVTVVTVDDDDLREALHELVAAEAGLYLGAGRPVALGSVADGYAEARAALVAAVDRPTRWAAYTPVVDVAFVLPEAAAHRWAHDLMEVPESWEPRQTALYLETTRLVLDYGVDRTVAQAGVAPETIRRRARAVATACGLDFRRQGDRIVLALAIHLLELKPRTPVYEGPPVTLGDLLGDDEVVAWARGLLDRFGGDLLPVLVAWLECGMHTGPTAARLNLDVKTVRARLHRAEALGERLLITKPGRAGDTRLGFTNLVVAAQVTGVLSVPVLTSRHLSIGR